MLISDHDPVFRCELIEQWCGRRTRQRFGAVGEKGSIAIIERFFLTFKNEFTRRIFVPLRANAFRREAQYFIECYNSRRPRAGHPRHRVERHAPRRVDGCRGRELGGRRRALARTALQQAAAPLGRDNCRSPQQHHLVGAVDRWVVLVSNDLTASRTSNRIWVRYIPQRRCLQSRPWGHH